MADDEPDARQGFAALMNDAATAAAPPAEEAPYGWTTDAKTGEWRPKKQAGRPRKSPSVDELKAAKTAGEAGESGAPASPAADRPPDPKARKNAGPGKTVDVPQHRPGVITRGMNKRYRQLGKLTRPLDGAVGRALIQMSENTSEEPDEDTSVGACWDEVARSNPRVRRFCLAVIQGGAYGALVMAHAPLGLAVAMKFVSENPGFAGKMILSWAEPDPDTPEGQGGLPFGMTAADVADLMKMAEKIIPGEVLQSPAAAAGGEPPKSPPGFAHNGQGSRRQPKTSSRAARRGS